MNRVDTAELARIIELLKSAGKLHVTAKQARILMEVNIALLKLKG